jgi:hypothetical protein
MRPGKDIPDGPLELTGRPIPSPVAQQDPEPDERLDRLVDLQSAGSFPASDPPSSWAGA